MSSQPPTTSGPSPSDGNLWPSPADVLGKYLEYYGPWIESKLGAGRQDWTVVNNDIYGALSASEFPLDEVLTSAVMGIPEGLRKRSKQGRRKEGIDAIEDKLSRLVSGVEAHPSFVATASVHSNYVKGRFTGTFWTSPIEAKAVIAFQFGPGALPAVHVTFELLNSPQQELPNKHMYVVIRKDQVPAWNTAIGDLVRPSSGGRLPTLFTYHGGRNVTDELIQKTRFEDLTLDQTVVDLVWKDIQAFRARRAWFAKNHLPYRRGYLLHGAPGNGKTSLIRAILSHYKMDAHVLNLNSQNVGDSSITALYKAVSAGRQGVILFEDLDRAFPKTGERKSMVSMQALLNALDGVATGSGVIVIATANEPTALDKAILQRPGRFDRVVLFPNPSEELRSKYFEGRLKNLGQQELIPLVKATAGLSFAQLQETYILGGQMAYERGTEEITTEDMLGSARQLQTSNKKVTKDATKTGFGAIEE